MRIAHVVTFITPDNAFGGPVTVALGQARELARRGHEVTVFAGAPISRPTSISQDGYTLRLFPARRLHRSLGFAGMVSPRLQLALRASLPRLSVAHIHLARDLVTMPAARLVRRYGRVGFIAQTHGMIDRSERLLAKPVDAVETRKALASAHVVLTLTDVEDFEVRQVSAATTVRRVVNGVDVAALRPMDPEKLASPLVLFLARLHPIKRAPAFVQMANLLAQSHPTMSFLLAGPDEGDGEEVRRLVAESPLGDRITWLGAVSPARAKELYQAASVYVLPSSHDTFPMSLLEAFQAGVPAVITDAMGITARCAERGAAAVTDGTAEQLAAAVARIVDDPDHADGLRRRAHQYLAEELSIAHVVDELEVIYQEAQRR